jgi:hypothetical protein
VSNAIKLRKEPSSEMNLALFVKRKPPAVLVVPKSFSYA